MRQRGVPSAALVRLAKAQHDVVTREQALGLGLSRHTLARLTAQGQWQRLSPGLFVTHSATPSWASLAWGGVLLGGDGARLGGEASAHAHELVDEAPEVVQVLVPHDVVVRRRPPWLFVRERPGARSPRTTGSPPRTLVPDAVLDLCDGASPRVVEDLATRAVQRRLTTAQHLRRALAARSRHSARRLLEELLADVVAGAESPLELRYLRDVERRHGLPRGSRQHLSADGSARRDVVYEAYGLVVELDGRRGHEGEGRFKDMSRDNAALMEQLLTLRYGHGDVTGRPCEVAWEVAQLLTLRGWPGPPRSCSWCAAVVR